ncbi:hypothetical protein WUBG_17378 [Wuchereria bancrofti]|uniref:Uncharacterized protein n=1 Tax=Wuchereria bancrofti TaxID=6293 RepID=J9DPZ5_WUCBA|nr:hypothetical protein WUBG_17378 [Wuchereria bancrofti]
MSASIIVRAKSQHETKARIIKEKLMRLEKYIGTLEKINDKWLQYIQQTPMSQR